MAILFDLFSVVSFLIVTAGILSLLYFPLSLLAELRLKSPPVFNTKLPLVSIIVPVYNEEKVIEHCIESILASEYWNFEVILVDDGSRDGSLAIMRRHERGLRVRVIAQKNAGKAAALNAGYRISRGEILMFVDADGIFTPTTIREMLNAFTDARVGAVCGSDTPVNLDRLQTRLMSIQTHVGTGLVRRALAELNCLPIVSGNIGAFRAHVLQKAGLDTPPPPATLENRWGMLVPDREKSFPFRNGFIGEDLELTWRIHKAGYRVGFAPRAFVMAEVPSTLRDLWRQRVRWARGLLQTAALHRDMFFNFHYGPMGLYLPINFWNMVVVPILQLLLVILLAVLVAAGYRPIGADWLNLLLWAGLGGALFTVLFAIALTRTWRDLRHLYVLPLWIPYSLMMDLVMVWAIVLELSGRKALWNKLDRTGVVSMPEWIRRSGKA